MRQTEDEPFVGYVHQGREALYTDNTLHTLLLTEKARSLGLTYGYLLAVLNSRVLREIYQAVAQEEGRTLAQVKTTLVNRLPIVIPQASARRALEALVEQVQSCYKEGGLPLDADAEPRIEGLQTEIDEGVRTLYEVVLEGV